MHRGRSVLLPLHIADDADRRALRDIDDLPGPPVPLRAELAWGIEGTPEAYW